jgi:hypothetical protein
MSIRGWFNKPHPFLYGACLGLVISITDIIASLLDKKALVAWLRWPLLPVLPVIYDLSLNFRSYCQNMVDFTVSNWGCYVVTSALTLIIASALFYGVVAYFAWLFWSEIKRHKKNDLPE